MQPMKSGPTCRAVTVLALALTLTLSGVPAAPPAAASGGPQWRAEASEKLVKLPAGYLAKAVDNDFAGSELAAAMGRAEAGIAAKADTLAELQDAITRADGEVAAELRHRFLAEKRAYIELMGERAEMERRKVKTTMRLYEQILERLEIRAQRTGPAGEQLRADREDAQRRFESVAARVDMDLFGSANAEKSRYGREYAKNMQALEALAEAVKSHPMNAAPHLDGREVGKQEYLRHLLAEGESRLALLDQEEQILGYMAKLVALDAVALSEGLGAQGVDMDETGPADVSAAVEFFVGR